MEALSGYEEIVATLACDLGGPLSEKALAALAKGDLKALLSLKADPAAYDNAEEYFRAAQVAALVRKLQVSVPGVDPRAHALEKMRIAERRCALTNHRFKDLMERGVKALPWEPRLVLFLERVRGKIRRWMGPLPDSFDRMQPRFGPGAVVESVGGRTTAIDKISVAPTSYPSARFLTPDFEASLWARSLGSYDSNPRYVRGERFATVPKDWDIDRTIGVGASLPVFYQLGVDGYLRRRLKRIGIDLDTGQALHRRIACEASRAGGYATIDLVSASDTIARHFVRYLLSENWYQLLDSLRAPHLEVDGDWWLLERFSSMGNGFTFSLQTMIFLAVVCTACEIAGVDAKPGRDVYVYGDDIIVRREGYNVSHSALRFCGFEPNERKSFGTGPFRESCGGDYWLGEVVRPHFQKVVPASPAEWISLANGLRRVAFARYGDLGPFKRAWLRCVDRIPSAIRKCRGPTYLGDLVLHDHPGTWRVVKRHSRYYLRVWRPVAARVDFRRYDPGAVLAFACYSLSARLSYRRVAGYRFGMQQVPSVVWFGSEPLDPAPWVERMYR